MSHLQTDIYINVYVNTYIQISMYIHIYIYIYIHEQIVLLTFMYLYVPIKSHETHTSIPTAVALYRLSKQLHLWTVESYFIKASYD